MRHTNTCTHTHTSILLIQVGQITDGEPLGMAAAGIFQARCAFCHHGNIHTREWTTLPANVSRLKLDSANSSVKRPKHLGGVYSEETKSEFI